MNKTEKNTRDYVHEKLTAAVRILAKGAGVFEDRLRDATISQLIRLQRDDLSGDLGDDLNFILDLTVNNMQDGVFLMPISDGERQVIVDKMFHLIYELR